MSKSYDLAKIRALLLEAFSDEALRCFCYDEAIFWPVYDRLTKDNRKSDVAKQLLGYAEQTNQLSNLLTTIKKIAPDIYEKHFPYHTVDFAIITTSAEEQDAILSKFPTYQKLKSSHNQAFIFFSSDLPVTFSDGSNGFYHIIVLSLLNIVDAEKAIAARDVIRYLQPRYLILGGLAQGVAEKGVQCGDVLISSHIVEYQLSYSSQTDSHVRWTTYEVDPRLVWAARCLHNISWQKLLTIEHPSGALPNSHIGRIASGREKLDFSQVSTRHYQTWSQLIGIEMIPSHATATSLQAASYRGFLTVRGVADLIDDRLSAEQIEQWRLQACDVAASYIVALLQSAPVDTAPARDKPIMALPSINSKVSVLSGHFQDVKIFLCYAREDTKIIEQLYEKLCQAGFDPWMDTKNILPGQDWQSEIQKAIRNTKFFLACLSQNSIKPSGYLQEEIRQALDYWQDPIYLIPVRLGVCELPETLKHIHWLDLFQKDGWEKLLDTIRTILEGWEKQNTVIDTPTLEWPYGTMPLNSRFYIERKSDQLCWESLKQPYATTLFVQAPRQMGKSSLMLRILDQAKREVEKQAAYINLQMFSDESLKDEESFLLEFCSTISEQLDISNRVDKYWQGKRTNIRKCTRYLSDYIFPNIKKPFVLAIDEVERMTDSPFRVNFFGMLRTWHNNRAIDKNFARMSLFFSSYVGPYRLIDNPNQSPFNVAQHIPLQDFTREEIQELNQRHRSPLSQNYLDDLFALVGGHPFLIRLALYHLVSGTVDIKTLLNQTIGDNSVFGDHLRRRFLRLSGKPELREAMRCVCSHQPYDDDQSLMELEEMGLIKQGEGRNILPRNTLYAHYFKSRLND